MSDGQPTKTIVRLKHPLSADTKVVVELPDCSPMDLETMFAKIEAARGENDERD